MKCAFHPEADSLGFCSQCGKALCAACRRDVKGVFYCEDCLAARVSAPVGAEGAPNPGAALFLGIIPGVGAFYNGEFTKGFVHLVIFAGFITALASGAARGIEPLVGLLLAGFIVYMPIEAYQTAKRRAAGLAPAPGAWENLATGAAGRATPLGPLILIILGVVFLLNTLDLIDWHWRLGRFWPLILIGVGIWMLLKRQAAREQAAGRKEDSR